MDEILDSIDGISTNKKIFNTASKDKRLANYFIDLIGYFILSGLVGMVIGLLAISTGNEIVFLEGGDRTTIESRLIEWLWGMIIVVLYYTVLEYFFKGKTLGKLITKTRAVTLENERLDFQTAFIRSLCRVIPFEAFSFIGEDSNGWHDSISKTKVIEDDGWYE